ncbi:MAG: carbohydrate kinase [Ilumatobacteraceae bacterium]|nr:carbohydrate kinase [Ilumatobacteraceae bacterium]
MISVIGEALIDLVITPAGQVDAKLGGAPFNTASACGRLGADVRFVGAVSDDRFGSMLTAQLIDDRVDTSSLVRVGLPTTLAAAELDAGGTATYRFYIDGTSAPALSSIAPESVDGPVIFTGGLGLVLEPMAAAVEAAIGSSRADQLVMVDVNCRPKVIADRTSYVERVARVIGRADVVKVSDEDLDYLSPGVDPLVTARALLETGPSAALVTRGGDGVHVLTAAGDTVVEVGSVEVIDTIGAGDSFGAGFLSWWVASGSGRDDTADVDRLVAAVRAANHVAGVVVTRRGADPPWRSELPADWSP